MTDTEYAIQSVIVHVAWWSNEHGWVDKESRTVFTHEEFESLNLPQGGRWVPIHPDEEAAIHDDEFPDDHSHVPQDLGLGGEGQGVGVFAVDYEGRHYWMEVKLTSEGIIVDAYDRYGENGLATWAQTYDELLDFVFANDPMTTRPRGPEPENA